MGAGPDLDPHGHRPRRAAAVILIVVLVKEGVKRAEALTPGAAQRKHRQAGPPHYGVKRQPGESDLELKIAHRLLKQAEEGTRAPDDGRKRTPRQYAASHSPLWEGRTNRHAVEEMAELIKALCKGQTGDAQGPPPPRPSPT